MFTHLSELVVKNKHNRPRFVGVNDEGLYLSFTHKFVKSRCNALHLFDDSLFVEMGLTVEFIPDEKEKDNSSNCKMFRNAKNTVK
ncbi:hypothetical protein GNP80_08945 [Aliivibrio fischeri]|uniref:hypothetical protein n=1 Tax=Aliivibrio fischeri TaxID=668 RepID=UPI0012D9926F|nr:hypothetical protein [Aliivibrio fischeri]MUK92568.1 hypothetical protein [Aliivibrio fischeri]